MSRNWREYNNKLVKRGEFYLLTDFIQNWNEELVEMNKNKRGCPFEYPCSFIEFAAFLQVGFNLPFRQLKGAFHPQSDNENEDEDVITAIDATGMKITNRGEWIREKWKKKKGWIKVHIIIDVKTKELLGIEITDERVGDNKEFENLVEQAENTLNGRKIALNLADPAHDTKDSFNYLKKKKIKSGIKMRKNASTRARGSPYRAKCVRELRKIGYTAWKKKYKYGMRWAAEGYFSAVKRIFGEETRATSVEGMMQEVLMKFLFYNVLVNME